MSRRKIVEGSAIKSERMKIADSSAAAAEAVGDMFDLILGNLDSVVDELKNTQSVFSAGADGLLSAIEIDAPPPNAKDALKMLAESVSMSASAFADLLSSMATFKAAMLLLREATSSPPPAAD